MPTDYSVHELLVTVTLKRQLRPSWDSKTGEASSLGQYSIKDSTPPPYLLHCFVVHPLEEDAFQVVPGLSCCCRTLPVEITARAGPPYGRVEW